MDPHSTLRVRLALTLTSGVAPLVATTIGSTKKMTPASGRRPVESLGEAKSLRPIPTVRCGRRNVANSSSGAEGTMNAVRGTTRILRQAAISQKDRLNALRAAPSKLVKRPTLDGDKVASLLGLRRCGEAARGRARTRARGHRLEEARPALPLGQERRLDQGEDGGMARGEP